jgi:hypothetical protein
MRNPYVRSPYLDILEKATNTPKTVGFTDAYDASIAATCLRALARARGITDLNVRKIKTDILVWRGQLERIPFKTPGRNQRYISEEDYARAQVLGVFGQPLHGATLYGADGTERP